MSDSHPSSYLRMDEFWMFIDHVDSLLDAIRSLKTQPLKRRIGVFRPRTWWGLTFPPKHLSADKFTDGIPFGEGDFHGMLVSIDGRLRIAVPVPKSEWYRVLPSDDYIMYYMAFGKYSLRSQALANIVQSLWYLERLLPNGHELKVTPYGAWSRVDTLRIVRTDRRKTELVVA